MPRVRSYARWLSITLSFLAAAASLTLSLLLPLSAAPLTAKRLESSASKGRHHSLAAGNTSTPIGSLTATGFTLHPRGLADCFASRAYWKPGQTVQMCLLR